MNFDTDSYIQIAMKKLNADQTLRTAGVLNVHMFCQF